MRPEFSEFSYGYALTSDLVDRFGFRRRGAPVFLSLAEEGSKGFDMKLPGLPVFLQFKVSDIMRGRHSLEAKKGIMKVPYFRMHLRALKHSNQHDLLLALETASKGNQVFYVAPRFHRTLELNRSFMAMRVMHESIFWRPSAIGRLPDRDEHHIAFRRRSSYGVLCSTDEPSLVEGMVGDNFGRVVEAAVSSDAASPITDARANRLIDDIMGVYGDHARETGIDVSLRGQVTTPNAWRRAAYVAQSLLDCRLLVAFRM